MKFKMQEDMKNRMVHTKDNIYSVFVDEEGNPCSAKILPQVVDVREIETEFTLVILVEFADGTKERAVLHPEDEFSFEVGVSICLAKRLLSNIVPNQGGSTYNKLMKQALRVFDRNREREEYEKLQEYLRLEKAEREAQRIKEKRERRKRAKEEREIEIQKEAYKRAIIELRHVGIDPRPYEGSRINVIDAISPDGTGDNDGKGEVEWSF